MSQKVGVTVPSLIDTTEFGCGQLLDGFEARSLFHVASNWAVKYATTFMYVFVSECNKVI